MDFLHACTIAAVNYIGKASVLADSFLFEHPHSTCTILIVADQVPEWLPQTNRLSVVLPTDIGFSIAEIHQMALIYNVTELSTAVKPMLLKYLTSRHKKVVYLDPDMEVLQNLTKIENALDKASIVLTPHFRIPKPTNRSISPTEYTMLEVGTFNLGFIAVSDAAQTFLDWWDSRLRIDCVVSAREQLFVDQKWINIAVGYWDVEVVRDLGINLAYWNFDEAPFATTNLLTIGNDAVALFHFSGLPKAAEKVWTTHVPDTQRKPSGDAEAVRSMFDNYRNRVDQREQTWELRSRPEFKYPFNATASGRSIQQHERRFVRAMIKSGEETPPDAFSADESSAYDNWLKSLHFQRIRYSLRATAQGVHTSFPFLEQTATRAFGSRVTKVIRRKSRG
jgi:hypothetical protein